jgi:uncharacterized membrane protein
MLKKILRKVVLQNFLLVILIKNGRGYMLIGHVKEAEQIALVDRNPVVASLSFYYWRNIIS